MCKIDLSFWYFNCCESTKKLKEIILSKESPFVFMCLSLITFNTKSIHTKFVCCRGLLMLSSGKTSTNVRGRDMGVEEGTGK